MTSRATDAPSPGLDQIMYWLAENALVIWMGGAVALTMALIVYSQTRAAGAIMGAGGVLLVTALLLFLNRWLETPRETVARCLYELAATVEANDVPGVMAFLAPTANSELRNDVETRMPQVRIDRARVIGAPEVEMDSGDQGAIVKCRGIIVAVDKRDGMKGGADDRLTLRWVKSGDRWLLESYTSEKNWNRAIGRPRAKR